ncbi:MAG: ABC transporter C-terminal domain-containing protein, partial [Kiritimatiellota bacterium]|nr:ABC transporter C-terminal domain-containing protein [Kiritimatiellota bacterium]
LEADIERFETHQKTLAAQLENPVTYTTPGKPMALNRELTQVVESLRILYAEWEQAAANEEWEMVDG